MLHPTGRFNFEEGEPRANFDSFWNGFLSMYQVSSQQNWPYVMFDSMRVAGKVTLAHFAWSCIPRFQQRMVLFGFHASSTAR